MDHLPLPQNPISASLRIPYLCRCDADSSPYDGGDFSTYPTRAGWPNPQRGEFAQLFLMRAQHRKTTGSTDGKDNDGIDEELEAFLQAWCYFGALHVFLAPVGLYDAMDYIGHDSEGSFIHTTKLLGRLENWKTLIETLSGDAKAETSTDIETCFAICRDAIPMTSMTGLQFSEGLLRSLDALHEILYVAFYDIFKESNNSWSYWSVRYGPKPSEDERQLMISRGWCPYDIEVAMQEFRSNVGRHYLQKLDKGSSDFHKYCDTTSCGRMQIDLTAYQPRHIEETCSCQLLGIDPQKTSNYLQNGTFPVFRVENEANKVSIEVRPYEDDVPYIAFSHIWAEGLGNPRSARLPTCQLLKLQRLADNITGQTYAWRTGDYDDCEYIPRVEKRQFFLWIDTLCCPPAPPGCTEQERDDKHFALGKMMDVYRKASYVLTLERSVEKLNSAEIGELESSIRIFTSGWMRRLWTFQEASLAQKLLVKFQEDRPVDMAQLWKVTQETAKGGNLHMRSISWITLSHFPRLRNYHGKASSPEPDLRAVLGALVYRKASVASDEPICLGAVLGLDVQQIASTPEQQRMAEMWRLLSLTNRGIPDTMIFNPVSRIETNGFRWAPKSVLTKNLAFGPETALLAREINPTPARLTPDGLCVYRSGWRIRHGKPPPGFPPDMFGDFGPPQPIFFLRDCDGRWLHVMAREEAREDSSSPSPPKVLSPGNIIQDTSRDWYLLRDGQEPLGEIGTKDSSCRGILGHFQYSASGTRVFRPTAYVWICRSPPTSETIWDASYKASVALQRSWSIFLFGLLSRLRDALERFTAWAPARFHEFGIRLMMPFWNLLIRRVTSLFANELRAVCRNKLSSRHVVEAMTRNGMSVNEKFSVALTPTLLKGRYVDALEELPPTTEWIVD